VIIAVVVGGLFVVAILGILAAIAIPNFLTAKERAQQKRTMADMRAIGTAIEAYKADNNAYPNASSIEALAPMLAPKYIRDVPEHDGWRHRLMYFCYQQEAGRCSGYVLGSGGRDGMFEHSEPDAYLKEPVGGATTSFNCDLIFADGQFIEYPEGTQH
jgi:general secretion pathway protein G